MNQFSLRNRIAFYYIAVTALLVAVLFFLVYFVVLDTVYTHLDTDLDAETHEIYSSLVVLNDTLIFANPSEWAEREHGKIEVNPTFIQVVDTLGHTIRKSSNLRDISLSLNTKIKDKIYFDNILSGSPVRQLQTSILNPGGKILGFLIIALPLEESEIVIKNLKLVLVITYPIVLIALFFISRLIAGKSISPINKVIITAERITNENLNERIELPRHKDEIHTLTQTINSLLDRLQDVVLREKQFTADASHELRTPLSIIKGTLEVLTRKQRDPQQYVEKINQVISEVDRMSLLVDQLLELARFESGKINPNLIQFDLKSSVQTIYQRLEKAFTNKNLILELTSEEKVFVTADPSMTEIILENILSNSIKYSFQDGTVSVKINREAEQTICEIADYGTGIPENQLPKIFDRFYRVDESRNSQIVGKGLGLAIVKRLADLQNIKLDVQSKVNGGTTFTIIFNS